MMKSKLAVQKKGKYKPPDLSNEHFWSFMHHHSSSLGVAAMYDHLSPLYLTLVQNRSTAQVT